MESMILPSCKILPPKFPDIPKTQLRNVRTSNFDSQITLLCRNGRLNEAISSLQSTGSSVNDQTLSLLIQSCIDSRSISLGRKLHSLIENGAKELDPFTATKFVGMYAKCGFIEDARKLFEEMSERNLYAWSAMIGAFSRARCWSDVVELFYSMIVEDGIIPDEFLLPKIISACANIRDVETGRLIHGMVMKCGMNAEVRVNNAILTVYAKCGCLELARRHFDSMEVRDRDTVSWNAMITGYCSGGDTEEALRLFKSMRENGVEPGLVTWNILISSFSQLGKWDMVMEMMEEMEEYGVLPDVITWTSMISGFAQSNLKDQAWDAFKKMIISGVQPNEVTLMSMIGICGSLKDLKKGRELHARVLKEGFGDDVVVGNTLVDMYSKCGKLEDARVIFDNLSRRDVYTWNSMIGGYCQSGYCGQANNLFLGMQDSDVKPNVVTLNTMIAGYMQSGDEDQAMDLFHGMEKDGFIKPDIASWNTLITGYVQNGNKDRALRMFRHMQSLHVKPNSVTILSILHACANLVAESKVKEIHCCVLRRNLGSNLSVSNSLIDTFAKSGNLEYSISLFNSLSVKDIITWNTLLAGYVMHGRSVNAIELFEQMRKADISPNRGTFASMITAYGLAGMVSEGSHLFSKMISDYYITPTLDHCVAVVHLYGRSGKLEEAVQFIDSMNLEPNSSIWIALLTASRVHGNAILALYAAEKLLELQPEEASTNRLVSQLYDLCAISEGSARFKKLRKKKDLDESLSWSCIRDKNTIQLFVRGNCTKQISEPMNQWIDRIGIKSRRSDFSSWLPIEEEEGEDASGFHSEKLAFAFALSKASGTSQCIRVVKNVRMCKGCHETAKFVSKAYQRDIYLSDTKCLHHFRDGHCSCNDYW